ncbi:multidrug efflux pump subunit AcrB [Nonlabens dokdonensis]|uniref:AcrB, cation/multidrug efflux pump n=2 Tax=Nonlabens dokdonensis TaxID=328515 RepID=L7WAQ8_NONDD|nr:efflux RND transporter permease subunit [Nonlabens dokdonensis]AGC75983.1 AcrB, cation/multidrug efflux pump [Nonlabens dokdonensis DSW-6]PZX43659.1 multidrug efflux pump subunit AcrB [Nonlabens dokdonensis]
MRKVIAYFIKHHVAVNVVIAAFVIFGVLGVLSLKSSFFPLVDSKIITINVIYPGASPQEIEEGVVLKIEDNLKGIEGIDRVTSASRENSGTITVEIIKGYDIDFMLLEIKNAVDRVPSFPVGMEPLVVAKQENARPTIVFSLSGKNVPLKTLKQLARDVENDLRGIDGISQISIAGYPDEEIEIAVNENTLLGYNLTFQEVADAVAASNILTTGGNIKTNTEEYLIRANNRSYYGDELSFVPVRTLADGSTVYLKDVAEIRDRFSETPNASYFNEERSVNITVTSTNSEDLIVSADKVKEYIEEYNQRSSNVELNVVRDLSITLNQRTALLTENAIVGMLLVLLFLSIFLNTRLAFWVAFGLPIAFLGMFIFAGQFDVTINVLSLFGMIIVIGILVDDGIVIAENIYQHYEDGKSPVQAAIDGTMEVIPPILSAIITTILAFSTFLFLDGRIGEFFSEVSVIVILTLTVSLVEALIILPAHLAHSKALKPRSDQPKKGIARLFQKMRVVNDYGDKAMNWMRDTVYAPALRFTIKYKLLAFSFFLSALLLTIGSVQGGIVGVTLFPSISSDQVSVNLSMPNGTAESITDSIISSIEEKAKIVNKELTKEYLTDEKYGDTVQLFENIIKAQTSSSSASLSINLLPGETRPEELKSPIVANRLRELVGTIPGAETLTFGSGGNFGGSPVAVSLLSNDISELKAATEDFKEILSRNPLLKDIEDNDPAGIKEINLELNDNAFALGLNSREIMSQVRAAFFGREAQRFQRGQDEIRVWVRYDRENRSSIKDLDEFRITTPTGDKVPLRDVASYTIKRGDVVINHLEGRREILISADMKDPNQSATDILEDIRTNIIPDLQKKYPTISPNYLSGQAREAEKISSSAGFIFPIVLLLIYFVIAFTFRSGTQPIMLILLIPFSFIAVAWGHWIHGFPVNILSMLGIIALIGIMVNDGLVLIGKFNSLIKSGLQFDEALFEAGKSRFRAIFLTSLTTVAGLAPLLLEKSRQAQFLKPMAISISYGIGIATLLTLLLLPLFLSFGNNIKVWIHWLKTGEKIEKTEVTSIAKEQQALEEYENE